METRESVALRRVGGESWPPPGSSHRLVHLLGGGCLQGIALDLGGCASSVMVLEVPTGG